MKFPKGKPILENTKLGFVNFDRILNAAKLERSYKISAYISIIYPDMVDMILLKAGEPFNAITFSHGKKELAGISETIEKAKKSEFAIVNFYEVPEELINFILISATKKPIFSAVGNTALKKIIKNKDSIVAKFHEIKFNGFVELVNDLEHNFFRVSNGEISRCYFSSGPLKNISWDELILFLEKLMKTEKELLIFNGFPYQAAKTEIQATPPQVSLFIKAINNTFTLFSDKLGSSIVSETAESSYKRVQEEFNFLQNTSLEDAKLSGNITTNPDLLVDVFVYWFELIKASFSMIIGEDKTEEIVRESIKEYRFALKAIGFYEKSSFVFKE